MIPKICACTEACLCAHTYLCVCMLYMDIHKYTFPHGLWKQIKRQSWPRSPMTVPTKSMSSWEKWLLPRLGQGRHKINLEPFVMPEFRNLFFFNGTYHKDTGISLRGHSQVRSGIIWVWTLLSPVMNYKPLGKIVIHKPILIRDKLTMEELGGLLIRVESWGGLVNVEELLELSDIIIFQPL